MKTKMNIKALLLVGLTLTSSIVCAQRRYYGYYGPRYYRPIVTTVVTRPAVTTHISNRLSKKDRLEMALAYLKDNKALSISKYSKMTGMSKTMAEAELDAFAVNKGNPIVMVRDGSKKLYVIR